MSTQRATKRRAEGEAPPLLSSKQARVSLPDAKTASAAHLAQRPPIMPPFGGCLEPKPDTLTVRNIYDKKSWVDVPELLMVQLGRKQQLPSKLEIEYSFHVHLAAIRVPPFVIHALQPLTSLTRIEVRYYELNMQLNARISLSWSHLEILG